MWAQGGCHAARARPAKAQGSGLLYWGATPILLPFLFPFIFFNYVFERFCWITSLESEIQSRNSWCHWGIGQWVKYFDLIISVFFQVLTSVSSFDFNIQYRYRWGTVHCLTHCTRKRWKSSWSCTNHLPELQRSGRGAKAAVLNTGDTLVRFGSLPAISLDGSASLAPTLVSQ